MTAFLEEKRFGDEKSIDLGGIGMAENQFPSTVDALVKGMDHFITSKTVVGEPVKVDENTKVFDVMK